ncbi:MAG: prenyltransferase, partial [Oligosphaeraceae bacterium]|nr:prenyltransferase [Oligosphaeraceae bacterium]
AGILIANEIPDAPEDQLAHKRTLVVRIGAGHGYLLYALVVLLAAVAVCALVTRGTLPPIGMLAIPALGLPAAAATARLHAAPADKLQLVKASKLAIAAHIVASLAMIVSLAFRKG